MMQLNTKNVEIIIFFAFYYLHFERDVLSYRRIRRNYGMQKQKMDAFSELYPGRDLNPAGSVAYFPVNKTGHRYLFSSKTITFSINTM